MVNEITIGILLWISLKKKKIKRKRGTPPRDRFPKRNKEIKK